MRILEALDRPGAEALAGIVEARTEHVRESRKASREWVNHLRDPENFPRPDRPRWEDWRRHGRPTPAAWQVPVLILADHGRGRCVDALADRRAGTLDAAIARAIGPRSLLCWTGGTSIGVARDLRPSAFALTREDPRHAQHCSGIAGRLAARLRAFLKPFRGPATRHLPRYLAWFTARLAGPARSVGRDTWHRLLAA
jgi:hypothetical protein